MSASNGKNETSDNPKSRGRQAEPSNNEVGQRIETALGERTRTWLARASGLPESTISDAIKRGPSRSGVALSIAHALGRTTDWLLTGIDPVKAQGASIGQVGMSVDAARAELAGQPVRTEVLGTGAVGYQEMKSLVFGDSPLPALPLYGSAQGADMEQDFETVEVDLGEVLDYLQRPVALANDEESYALTVVGSSMAPRFKPGERVGVSPRAHVEIGDDVIVQLRGENSNRVRQVLIKELVRRSASHITLKQWNPECELQLARSDVLAMHKVKGHFL